jgi:hypothetical protein
MSRGRTGALLTLPPPPGNPGDPAGPLWSVTRALPVSTSRNWCLLAQESQETPVSGSGHQFLGVRAPPCGAGRPLHRHKVKRNKGNTSWKRHHSKPLTTNPCKFLRPLPESGVYGPKVVSTATKTKLRRYHFRRYHFLELHVIPCRITRLPGKWYLRKWYLLPTRSVCRRHHFAGTQK